MKHKFLKIKSFFLSFDLKLAAGKQKKNKIMNFY